MWIHSHLQPHSIWINAVTTPTLISPKKKELPYLETGQNELLRQYEKWEKELVLDEKIQKRWADHRGTMPSAVRRLDQAPKRKEHGGTSL